MTEKAMTARIYTTVPGHVLCIGTFGFATNDAPALVPDDVAAQLERERRADIRVERPQPAAPAKNKPAGSGKVAAHKGAGESEE